MPMADIPTFTVLPPLRCFDPVGNSLDLACAAEARWMRRSGDGSLPAFYCDGHREPGDTPIAGPLVVRRVSLVAEVLFCAVTPFQNGSQTEAVTRLEQAVGMAGGLLNLVSVTSTIGRWTPVSAPRGGKGGRPPSKP